ncbi:serine/threonine protein kinase [Streptomyces sp. YC504]|uniref:non-specific serine/threonine protein kinase n=1 Tax=Streptomyces mesophilus TaxID=1775132 RepID=A0A6G4XPD9_9ACTN|nr:serine/threonine-protein kinase [Streptomyces mesophilus]NGO78481.1 serine/threonine protein kinase [Streptomyces mesophilus]
MSDVPGATAGGAGEQPLIAGRYRLLGRLGEGGMGTVWRARDEVLHREVAVKEVRAPAGLPTRDVERMYARLEREAWAAARISHRGVVTVYDVAMQDHRPWIVMELVRGLSLSDVLDAEGPMPPQRAAHIGADILGALRAAHEAGVLHRDVKPGNVLLSNDGRVVLTDFGIAMVEGSSALTITGEVIGSPEFLAPERALGRTPGPESDLWSLGVLLYAAVEGHSPFRQDTPLSTLRAVVDEELPPPRRAGALAPVIQGLLRKDPAERLSAADAERDLRIVGAGGQPTTGSQIPYLPTVAAPSPPRPLREPTTPYASVPLPSSAATTSAGMTTARSGDRPRRAALVLVAGIAALLLALGGLAYALLNRDNGGGSSGGSQGGTSQGSNGGSTDNTGGDEPGTDDPSSEGSNGDGEGDNGSGGGGDKTTTPPPDHSVTVALDRINADDYVGTCPPVDAAYPHFAATFTVGSAPVTVEYRWVAEPGGTTDAGWKSLEFSGSKTEEINHVEMGYVAGGTYEGTLKVEVRKPVKAESNTVSYTITCEDVPPTDDGGGTYTPNAEQRSGLTRRP